MALILNIFDALEENRLVANLLDVMSVPYTAVCSRDLQACIIPKEDICLVLCALQGFSENCRLFLTGLERWADTSGSCRPPVIVLVDGKGGRDEQLARMTCVDLFITTAVSEMVLQRMISQALTSWKNSQRFLP